MTMLRYLTFSLLVLFDSSCIVPISKRTRQRIIEQNDETINNTQSCTLFMSCLCTVRYQCVIVSSLFSCDSSICSFTAPFHSFGAVYFVIVTVVVSMYCCFGCVFFFCLLFLYRFSSVSKAARKRTPLSASLEYKFKAICRLRFIYKSKIHHTRHIYKTFRLLE